MTPEQLKASILQLAIQGKLVEQRTEDGTAEDLYQQIQEEKQNLIKEGKLKKEKPLAPIEDDEIPFDIPCNWKWVRLKNICSKIVDGDHNPPKGENSATDYLMLSASNINQDTLIDLNKARYLSKECYLLENERTKLEKGDILLTTVGTIGRSCIFQGGMNICFQRSVTVISAFVFNKYLKYILDSNYVFSFMNNNAKGTAQKGFYLNQVDNLVVPIPPLAEQKRIVDKVEELLPLVEKYKKAYSELEILNSKFSGDMKKSILQYSIQGKLVEQRPEEGTAEDLYQQIQEEKQNLIKEGKLKKEKPLAPIADEEIPFDIPENWKWARVGSIGAWGAGSTPSRTNSSFYGGDIPWLKTGDLTDGDVDTIPEKITQLALDKCSLKVNPVGSVLIAMYGATIGKLGILTVPATTNQACCACSVFNGMFNKYLFYFLMSRRDSFTKIAVGGAQPNISKEKIVNSLIPLPPLSEQKRIVAKVEELLALCDKLKFK